jgi:hypothetical protein
LALHTTRSLCDRFFTKREKIRSFKHLLRFVFGAVVETQLLDFIGTLFQKLGMMNLPYRTTQFAEELHLGEFESKILIPQHLQLLDFHSIKYITSTQSDISDIFFS